LQQERPGIRIVFQQVAHADVGLDLKIQAER
jgi:hypothetical protein